MLLPPPPKFPNLTYAFVYITLCEHVSTYITIINSGVLVTPECSHSLISGL